METQDQNVEPDFLRTPTKFSKGLAAILFIAFPFVGFYLGYTFALKNTPVVEQDDVYVPASISEIKRVPVDTSVVSKSAFRDVMGAMRIQKWEFNPEVAGIERAEKTALELEEGDWVSINNSGFLNTLAAQAIAPNIETWTVLEAGYYITNNNKLAWVGMLDIYGVENYIVHAAISPDIPFYDFALIDPETFSLFFSFNDSDLFAFDDQLFVRESTEKVSWGLLPEVTRASSIRFFNQNMEDRVLYFTNETAVYAILDDEPSEGGGVPKTKNIFVLKGANPASFEILSPTSARDKTHVYKIVREHEREVGEIKGCIVVSPNTDCNPI